MIPLPRPKKLKPDVLFRAVLDVSGTVGRAFPDLSCFDLNPDQWVWAHRELDKSAGLTSSFPVRINIPESKKWGKEKPKPMANTFVSVIAYLTGMERDEVTGAIKWFCADLERVSYLGGS